MPVRKLWLAVKSKGIRFIVTCSFTSFRFLLIFFSPFLQIIYLHLQTLSNSAHLLLSFPVDFPCISCPYPNLLTSSYLSVISHANITHPSFYPWLLLKSLCHFYFSSPLSIPSCFHGLSSFLPPIFTASLPYPTVCHSSPSCLCPSQLPGIHLKEVLLPELDNTSTYVSCFTHNALPVYMQFCILYTSIL